MTLIDLAHTIRAAWDELFKRKPEPTNPLVAFIAHLEQEIVQLQADKARLEGKCEMLQLKVEIAQAPKPVTVQAMAPRVPPKFHPSDQESSWEAIQRRQREENERLDREEQATKA
jgi:hypothetical protein